MPWSQITDHRNDAPVVQRFSRLGPQHYLTTALDVHIPDVDELMPRVQVAGFTGVQPHKIVMFGEKSSLEPVLAPIARSHSADLYLMKGEISDTHVHTMAEIGADDGRPMIVLTFSDCDPSGWQMPVSIARKLQAFKTLEFPHLEFQVYRVALTPDQVGEYCLPSTPLKASERRGDRWQQAMGVQQTEVDALATLQPGLLTSITRAAIAPFYDRTLESRVWRAREEWLTDAQAVVDTRLNAEVSEAIRAEVADKIDTVREQVDAVKDALRIDSGSFDLPEMVVPEAELNAEAVHGKPLLDSRWPFVDQCQALITSKAVR